MSLFLVVDNSKSALFIAASARAKIENAKVIAASDFASSAQLIRELIQQNPEVVLFSWRKALLDSSVNKRGLKLLAQLREKTSIGILIPDHLGLEPLHFESEVKTLQLSDFYLVTSELLFSLYSNRLNTYPPHGVLHDIPNHELIRRIRLENTNALGKKPTIIWVGNSKWGERYGFIDHKGFAEVIQPLQKLIHLHDNCMILEVIDSSKNRLKQTDVLRRIRDANVLLQVSKSEGSGLPILEALGLGTQVLTTPVGISREVLSIFSDRNFTSRNINEVHQKLHQLVKDAKISDRASYVKTFEEYVQSASVEGIPKGIYRQIISEEYMNRSRTIPVQIAWIIRYFRELFA